MWRKFMQNKYFRKIHNHFFNFFHYEELIGEIFLNNNIVIDIERRKNIIEQISRPYFRTILVGMITFFVKFATLMLIIQPEWINNYNYFEILSRMLPNDGRKYLSAALNMCAINTVVIAFYATSTNYEQFRFLLPIRYSQCRHLNKQDSDHYEWIKDYVFSITRISMITPCALLLLGMILMSLLEPVWQISIFWTLFWLLTMNIWALHTASGKFLIKKCFLIP